MLNLNNGTSREIFYTEFPSWDVTGNIQWLGQDHLFFLRHCGSSCQGLSLLNTHTGEVSNATLGYQSFLDDPPFTHFNDWFGKEYHWEGLLKEIKSKRNDNKNYLVFVLEDLTGKGVDEKLVEFRGN